MSANSDFLFRFNFSDNIFIFIVKSNFYKFKSSVIQTLDQDCPGEALELERVIDGYSRAGLDLLCGDFT